MSNHVRRQVRGAPLIVLNPYAIPFLLTAAVMVLFGAYMYRSRFFGGIKGYLVFSVLCTAWSITDAIDILSTGLPEKELMTELRFIFIVWTVMIMMIEVTRVVGQGLWLTRSRVCALAVVPLITTALTLTTSWTGLMIQDAQVEFNGLFYVTTYQPGIWFFVYLFYSFGVSLSYLAILSFGLMRNRDNALYHRNQLWIKLLALSLPPIVTGFYMLAYDSYGFFVPTSLVTCFGTIIFTYSYSRHGILDLAPIGRSGIVDKISDLMLILDNDDRIVDINRGMRTQLFGSEAAPIDRSIETVLSDKWPELLSSIKEGVKKGEVPLRGGDITKTYDCTIDTLTRPKIGKVGTIVLLRDITEKKRNEEALAQSERRFRELMERAPFPVLVLDPSEDRILYANSCLYSVLRIKKGERSPESIFADPLSKQRMIEDLKSAKEVNNREVRLRRSDGDVFWAVGSASIVQFEGKDAILSTFNDISPIVQAKEELALVNQRLKLISSITQHDLVNKLTITSGYIEIMKRNRGCQDEYLNKIERTTYEAQYLIRFTQEYQNVQANPPVWHHIGNSFLEACSQLDTGKLTLEVKTGDLSIYSDDLFIKVFYNLVDNTLRYGENVTKINLEYEINENGLSLRYSDDGVGVSIENKERIFERGFGKNTGLGLSFCREIMRMTDMSISECGELGKGAIFQINVPNDRYKFGPVHSTV
jgi:PAS domain S-box-containing protein